jgi:hypothetical protein
MSTLVAIADALDESPVAQLVVARLVLIGVPLFVWLVG